MLTSWIIYVLAVVICALLFAIGQLWVFWVLLWMVVALPFVGLVLSLPSMVCARATCPLPKRVVMGEKLTVQLQNTGILPGAVIRGSVMVERMITDECWLRRPGQMLLTNHCGQLLCTPVKCRVYDYLGLFFLPMGKGKSTSVIVEPVAVKAAMPGLERYMAKSWRPKYGGGFGENHELRLFRPGDSLKQVHWKLSAKTGKLMTREVLVPADDKRVLSMVIHGSGDVLDQKFGKLSFLGQQLLERGMDFEIAALWKQGKIQFSVKDQRQLQSVIDQLLSLPPAEKEQSLKLSAGWHFQIGGEADG